MSSAFARPWVSIGVLTVFVLLAGCGGGSKNAPVTGTVTVKGQPLAKGSVALKPDAGLKLPRDPSATIENGQYTVYYDGKPGAPVGKYKVVVVAQEEVDSTKATAPAKSLVNAKYSDPDKTDLSIEVVPTPAPGAYDLKLK